MLKVLAGIFALLVVNVAAEARQTDSDAILQFQRAADRYAFQHRQVERKLGGEPSATDMNRGMRVSRADARDGDLFTPAVGAAFRTRLSMVLRSPRCSLPPIGSDFSVPRVHEPAVSAIKLPECVTASLPKLPPELEYRAAGVALLLVDSHAGMVVDVLHAALSVRD